MKLEDYFDFNDPEMSQHLWMYEGVTEYFASLVQVQYGLISLDEFIQTLREKMSSTVFSSARRIPRCVRMRTSAGVSTIARPSRCLRATAPRPRSTASPSGSPAPTVGSPTKRSKPSYSYNVQWMFKDAEPAFHKTPGPRRHSVSHQRCQIARAR